MNLEAYTGQAKSSMAFFASTGIVRPIIIGNCAWITADSKTTLSRIIRRIGNGKQASLTMTVSSPHQAQECTRGGSAIKLGKMLKELLTLFDSGNVI